METLLQYRPSLRQRNVVQDLVTRSILLIGLVGPTLVGALGVGGARDVGGDLVLIQTDIEDAAGADPVLGLSLGVEDEITVLDLDLAGGVITVLGLVAGGDLGITRDIDLYRKRTFL